MTDDRVPELLAQVDALREALRELTNAIQSQRLAGHPVSPKVQYAATQARALLAQETPEPEEKP